MESKNKNHARETKEKKLVHQKILKKKIFSIGKIISFLFTNWLENFNMNFCTLQQTCQFQNEVQKAFVKKSSVT
jgi:hypothetical protein